MNLQETIRKNNIIINKNDELLTAEKKYKTSSVFVAQVVGNFIKSVLKAVKDLNVDSLLSVGCGEGVVLFHLSEELDGLSVAGIDCDADKLAKARNNVPQANFKEASIYDLPYDDNSFNIVICLEVLEHLKSPQKALEEVRRVSNKYSLFSVPNEPWWRMANFIRGKNLKWFGDDPKHINHWTKRRFKNLIGNYYEVDYCKTVSFIWNMCLGLC